MREVEQSKQGAREIQVVVWAEPQADDEQITRFGAGGTSMEYEEAAPGETLADDQPEEGSAGKSEPAEDVMRVDLSPKNPEGRPVPEQRVTPPRPRIAAKGGKGKGAEEDVF
jgi:hypothetical protein